MSEKKVICHSGMNKKRILIASNLLNLAAMCCTLLVLLEEVSQLLRLALSGFYLDGKKTVTPPKTVQTGAGELSFKDQSFH